MIIGLSSAEYPAVVVVEDRTVSELLEDLKEACLRCWLERTEQAEWTAGLEPAKAHQAELAGIRSLADLEPPVAIDRQPDPRWLRYCGRCHDLYQQVVFHRQAARDPAIQHWNKQRTLWELVSSFSGEFKRRYFHPPGMPTVQAFLRNIVGVSEEDTGLALRMLVEKPSPEPGPPGHQDGQGTQPGSGNDSKAVPPEDSNGEWIPGVPNWATVAGGMLVAYLIFGKGGKK